MDALCLWWHVFLLGVWDVSHEKSPPTVSALPQSSQPTSSDVPMVVLGLLTAERSSRLSQIMTLLGLTPHVVV